MRIALDALASDSPYTQANGTVEISSVNVEWYAFLGIPDTYTGNFECSDEQLTQYWYGAAYTNEMCIATFTPNTTDPRDANSPGLDGKLVLQDGAKRDRDPYVGDVAVPGRTTYLTHLQASHAAKNVLADLAEHQRADGWIPPASISNYTLPLFDYPLWWVVSSWEYVLYTGDTDYAKTYWPNLVKVLDSFYPSVTNSSSELLSKGSGVTEGYGDYAFLPRTGQASYLGEAATSKRWNGEGEAVSKAINAHLWDAKVEAYLDSTNLTTSINQTRHAQDGNGIAVLAGVASPNRAKAALNYLSSSTGLEYGNAFFDGRLPDVDNATQRVYAFTSLFELQGRFLTPGLSESAIEEISRLYGWMATHDPMITNWEGIGPGGLLYEQGYTSMAHGWSTGIVSLMSNYVLGVMPTSPGFATWTLKPIPAGLKWAKGRVGTPRGDIVVYWRSEKNEFRLQVTIPDGTSVEVGIPAQEGGKILVDGEQVEAAYEAGYAELDTLKPGTHIVVAKQ